ncbi:MAG: hypothetical protein IIZ78_19845 [Clostridiales bacterium]|nr:hypothetical protein [Clostridiales bacterium]
MFDYFKAAMKEAKKQKEYDKRKARLLAKNMDYQFLEEIINKVNENPNLNVKITLADHTELNVCIKKQHNSTFVSDGMDFEEVR